MTRIFMVVVFGLIVVSHSVWAKAPEFRLERSATNPENIRIEAINQSARDIALALKKGGFLDFDGVELLSTTMISVKFQDIAPRSVLDMAADISGAAVTYRADGSILLRATWRPADYLALLEEFRKPFESPERAREALERLRRFEAPRNDGLLPPRSGYLDQLAEIYHEPGASEAAQTFFEERLQVALAYDAREGAIVATTVRMQLALLKPADDVNAQREITALWKRLRSQLENDYVDDDLLLRIGQRLEQDGKVADAVFAYQRILDSFSSQEDPEIWLSMSERAVNALLRVHQSNQDFRKFDSVLAQWQSRADGVPAFTPVFSEGAGWRAYENKQLTAALANFERDFAMQPALALADPVSLWDSTSRLAQLFLARGQFEQAANAMTLQLRIAKSCKQQLPEAAQIDNEIALLRKLALLPEIAKSKSVIDAKLSNLPTKFTCGLVKPDQWPKLLDQSFDLDDYVSLSAFRAEVFRSLGNPVPLEHLEAFEHALLLSASSDNPLLEVEDALKNAHAWRKALGQSEASIATREQTLRGVLARLAPSKSD